MNTVRFTHEQFSSLKDYLFSFSGKEAAAFLLAGYFRNDSGSHFTVKEIVFPSPEDYDEQLDIHLQISPRFINRVIGKAEQKQCCVVICHSHPRATKHLAYSPSDDYGEAESAKTMYDCLSGKPIASLLFGKKSIIGRFRLSPDAEPIPIDQVRIVGRRLDFLSINPRKRAKSKVDCDLFSRQVLALGEKFQQTLEDLTIGIVGLGGTGSAVAEQLTRIGIRKLVLADKDTFETSNLTRVYGSISTDTKKAALLKTTIAERNIKTICPETQVECCGDVISQKVLARLKNCDVIFSCTDRHAPRSVLNELCYQCFIPIIDVGVGLDAKKKRIQGGTIRASVIAPSLPCLLCSNIIRTDTISEEFLPDDQKQALKKEGYIQGITISETPSMVSFTTIASSYGIHIFIDMLCGFMNSQSYNYLIDIQTLSTNRLSSIVSADCACAKRLGMGDYKHFSAP